VISVATAVRSQSHVVIISVIIIIVAVAVTIKHGAFVIIRGHISKSGHSCEALTHDILYVKCLPSLSIMASLRQGIFKLCYDFRYLRTTLTNQNSIQEEIKSRLKSGTTCYHSVQNLLYSSWPSKNLKIKIYRNIILLVVLYGCETWSLTLREERKLKVFENGVLRRIIGTRRDEVTGE